MSTQTTSSSTTPNAERSVTWYAWDQMPRETVSPMLDRRLITGDRMMLAHESDNAGVGWELYAILGTPV